MTGLTIDEFAATLAALEAYARRLDETEASYVPTTRDLPRLIEQLRGSLDRLVRVTKP